MHFSFDQCFRFGVHVFFFISVLYAFIYALYDLNFKVFPNFAVLNMLYKIFFYLLYLLY